MTVSLVQDIAVVLLAAGAAGFLCRRIGLSTIVGYLVAGIIIGPNTPFKMVSSEVRIDELAQVGLVFVMFAIGLQLSLTKLARMGAGTIFATGLGALFMFMFTLLLGHAMGWDYRQSLFASGMLMVSSSAVISKVIQELHLTHDKTAQTALTVTVMEDIVAVVMLTILATVGNSETLDEVPGTGNGISGLGLTFTNISAYVVLILALCLLFVPRLLRRLDMSGDPELRTVSIAGLLLLLAVCASQAGFSTALGAFLFGAIIAELPQKEIVEKSFESVRSIFSSLFFVSIGMLARPLDLLDPSALKALASLVCFAMFVRPLACGFALVLVGVSPREAKRGGLLLTPLGEFTFIIAQSAIAASIFPDYFYPVAIALSILTVLATPIVNRYSDHIVVLAEKLEPKLLSKALVAYHEWFLQVRNKPPKRPVWRLTRPRFLQVGGEMLLVTGIFVFSEPVLGLFVRLVNSVNAKMGGNFTAWLADGLTLPFIFWAMSGVIVLMFLVSIWRNVDAVIMMLVINFERPLPRSLLTQGFRGAAIVVLLFWLYSILPSISWALFSFWASAGIILAIMAVVLLLSRRLIYWHSAWRASIEAVLSSGKASEAEAREEARRAMNLGLGNWDLHLQDCVVPLGTACAGAALSELAIPTRFGSVVIEVERNGHSILDPGPETRLYPGDKVLLLGKEAEIGQTRAFLEAKGVADEGADRVAARAVLETCVVQAGPRTDKSLAELGIARNTGVRIVGIQRDGARIINPTGREILRDGDGLLFVGTLEQTRQFTRWLAEDIPGTDTLADA
ncbi:MAG: cation:proton antiporter [Puniceicoccales bacterium]|jgi:CPA2 family monovalent cation:H+ antiporter-2|nr:cation:proton antiporter [Puniceicoccales bacterium]